MLVDIPQPVEDEADIVVPFSLLRSANGVLPRSFADRLSRSANGCPERIVRNPASRRPPSGAASSVCSSKSPNRRTARRKCGSVTPSVRRSAVDGRSRMSLVGQAPPCRKPDRRDQARFEAINRAGSGWEIVRETLKRPWSTGSDSLSRSRPTSPSWSATRSATCGRHSTRLPISWPCSTLVRSPRMQSE